MKEEEITQIVESQRLFPKDTIDASHAHKQQASQTQTQPRLVSLRNVRIVCLLLALIALVYSLSRVVDTAHDSAIVPPDVVQAQTSKHHWQGKKFEKILWVQSDIEFDALGVKESLTARQQIDVGRQSGYEVRIVDSISAYDWLSPDIAELIRKVKHNSRIYIPVADLLRIALLVEHGGVSIRVGTHLFTENMDWIQETINIDWEELKKLEGEEVMEYCDSNTAPQVVLFYRDRRYYRWYEENILIARPKSALLSEVFQEMVEKLLDGQFNTDFIHSMGKIDNLDKYTYMENLLSELINFRWHYWNSAQQFCQQYSVLSINKGERSYIQKMGAWIQINKDFVKDLAKYYQLNGKTKILEPDLEALTQHFLKIVKHENFENMHQNSIVRRLIQSESNKWILTPINKTRKVSFCVISLKQLNQSNYQQKIDESLDGLLQQTFDNWKAIYFVKGLENETMIDDSLPNAQMIKSSEWEGLNLQRAATKYCGEKDIGIILDFDQTLEQKDALSIIADKFQNKDVYGAFVSTKIGSKINSPNPSMKYYRTVMHTDVKNFRQLGENLRVVSLLAYRLVPQFDLHDQAGRYFNRELPFYTLVQLGTGSQKCENNLQLRYFLKQVQQKVEIPKYRVYLPEITVKMIAERNFNFDLYQYKSKYNTFSWCAGVEMYIMYKKHSLKDYFIYNNGFQFTGFKNRKGLPEKIPRKIHQIWVGDKPLPPHKKLLMQNTKKLHPSYQYLLWTNDNLTQDNFPATYDLIKLILQLGKTSPISKMAMVADIMRLQIIYNNGGVYLDSNYYIFKENALDDWLTYKAMMPGQMIPNYQEQRENGLFAAVKNFKNFERLLDHRRLSMLNIFARFTSFTTGPFYFVQSIYGAEQLDEDIYVAPMEHIYPFYDSRTDPCYCLTQNKNISSDLLFFKNKYAYYNNCSQTYPWSFGLDFFAEGGSWKW